MTPVQISLVQNSFRQVVPISHQAAILFYARLFELDPALRPLFRGDISEQGKKLMTTLALAVGMLHRPEVLLPQLRDLGARHADYGVRNEHYPIVGEALLWTLQKGLGPEFTPAVRDAWQAAFNQIADGMMEGARSVTSIPFPTAEPSLSFNR